MIYIAMLHCLYPNDVENLDPKINFFFLRFIHYTNTMGFLSLDRCPLCQNKSIPSLSYSPNSLTMFLLESGEAWCIISTRYSYLQRSPNRLCYIFEVSIHYSAKGGIGGGGGRGVLSQESCLFLVFG